MAISVNDLIDVVAQLCEHRQLRVTIHHTMKGAIFTGLSTALAGAALGPVGLAIGAILGGVASTVASSGKFKSVATVLKEMSTKEKQQLYNRIAHAFRNIGHKEIASGLAMLCSSRCLQEVALNVVRDYLQNQMNMKVM